MSQSTPVLFVVDDAAVRERLGTLIIFVGARGDVPAVLQAMNPGAADLFARRVGGDLRSHATAVAAEVNQAAPREESASRTLRDRYASLTRREQEVMALVVAGRLNKQVGAELGISEITVKAHRGQVMRKMKAESLPDLVRMYARLGLPSEDGDAPRAHALDIASRT
jgi:FixJ family two-component response regulator